MIKVKPEGRAGVWIIEKEDAIKAVNDFKDESVHSFLPGGHVILGCDIDKEDVVGKIQESDRLAILTGGALRNNLRHSLAVITDERLEMFDIGEITEGNLSIEP